MNAILFLFLAVQQQDQLLLLTKAIFWLSGDHEGVLIVPWPPYK
jgi:hypothetical protein